MSEVADTLPGWPQAASCYGWLALDARGAWRLRGETVSHVGLTAFLNAHYDRDDRGGWFVHNGPQRVFVDLEAAPLILRLQPDGTLHSHTGKTITPLAPVLLDENGCAFMATSDGPGLIDDRDLAGFASTLSSASGARASDTDLLAMLAGESGIPLFWRGLAVEFCPRAEIAHRLGYQPHPTP